MIVIAESLTVFPSYIRRIIVIQAGREVVASHVKTSRDVVKVKVKVNMHYPSIIEYHK